MNQAGKVVLASASPARAALLHGAGIAFEVHPAAVDEAAVRDRLRGAGGSAEEAALALAELKAGGVEGDAAGAVVIGADQILVTPDDGRWFDKPGDLAEARTHLQALRGRTHRLVTAVACRRDGQVVWRHVSTPVLEMRGFSDAFLDAYLALEGERVLGSVGAYRIEGPGMHLFERMEGEYAAILGLPLLPLLGFLREYGVLAG